MLSAYHALHCLKKLHLAFVGLQNASSSSVPDPKYNSRKGKVDGQDTSKNKEEMSLMHAEHCFAYLKQGVMCAGDTTLEGPDNDSRGLQGWGVVHQCRMWEGPEGVEGWRKLHAVS